MSVDWLVAKSDAEPSTEIQKLNRTRCATLRNFLIHPATASSHLTSFVRTSQLISLSMIGLDVSSVILVLHLISAVTVLFYESAAPSGLGFFVDYEGTPRDQPHQWLNGANHRAVRRQHIDSAAR